MSYAQEKQIGWLYWIWHNGASDSDFMNVVNGSTFGDWANTQGEDAAIKNGRESDLI